MPDVRRPVVLVVRDGWGHNPHPEWDHANAVVLANTPVDQALRATYPVTLLNTSGEDVGLPVGVMGNSEVGHQNLGAGRIVDQEVMRITRTIRDESFFSNPTLLGAFQHARLHHSAVHLLGLLSDGRVHSDLLHTFALLELARRIDFPAERLHVHVITDGRDTPPRSGLGFVERLEQAIARRGRGRIASLIGRYYAMDRDHRWERVRQAYELLTKRVGRRFGSASEALQEYYDHPSEDTRQGDEFLLPSIVEPPAGEPAGIEDGDAVIFTNYRGDRPRELCKAFVLDDQAWARVEGGGFDRGRRLERLFFAGMTGYESGLPIEVVFGKPEPLADILGQVISQHGLRQFRCAETEKYPHVTYFFNDYREAPFAGEERTIVPSPRDVSTYDQRPEMSANEVTEVVLQRLRDGVDDLLIVNYANADMVGHTGSLAAAIRAVETVDACVGRLVELVLACGGALLVTADHGNCEQMIDPATGGPHTAHTTYQVDCTLVDDQRRKIELRVGGRLADVAPTLLELLGVARPQAMSGVSLLGSG